MKRSPRYYYLAFLIILCAYYLRLSTLGLRSVWLDEGLNYWVAVSPTSQLIASVQEGLQHPPLYSVMLHLWMVLGQSEFVFRYLSLMFGVISVAGLILLGRKSWGDNIGLIAGSLIALSPPQIRYSQEGGQYALLVMMLVCCLLSLDKALKRGHKWWWAWCITAVFCLYIHYGTLVPIVAISVVALVELVATKKWKVLSEFVFAEILVGCMALPLAVFFLPLQFFKGPTAQAFNASLGDLPTEVAQFVDASQQVVKFQFVNQINFPLPSASELSLWFPMMAILSFALVAVIRNRDMPKRQLLFLLSTWLLYYIVSKFNLLPFVERYSLIIAPLLLLTVALGIGMALRASRVLGIILFFWLWGLAIFSSPPPQENVRAVAQFWTEHRKPEEITYIYYAAEPSFGYYLTQKSPRLFDIPAASSSLWYQACWDETTQCPSGRDGIFYGAWLRNVQPSAKVDSIANTIGSWPRRLWIVFSHARLGEEQLILESLSKRYRIVLSSVQSDASIYLFESQ